MLKQLLVLFLLLNALFWGLASHKNHCNLAKMLLGAKPSQCPPHWVHVYVMGLGSFIATLYLVQGNAMH